MTQLEVIEGAFAGFIVGAAPSYLALAKAYAAAKTAEFNGKLIEVLGKAQDTQASQLHYLSNGGGDAKIDAQLQRHRLIDAPNTTPSSVRPIVAAAAGDTTAATGDGLTGPFPTAQVEGGTE